MDQLKKPPPSDPRYLEQVREMARNAICIELREFDWHTLDAETARKVFKLLPKDR